MKFVTELRASTDAVLPSAKEEALIRQPFRNDSTTELMSRRCYSLARKLCSNRVRVVAGRSTSGPALCEPSSSSYPQQALPMKKAGGLDHDHAGSATVRMAICQPEQGHDSV
jgi:hypothetical protein